MTVQDEVLAVLKTERKKGEAIQPFVRRLFTGINELPTDEWEALSEPVQKWSNKCTEALKEKLKALPLPEGLENGDAEADEADEDEGDSEAAEAAADAAASKAKKGKGKAAAKKAAAGKAAPKAAKAASNSKKAAGGKPAGKKAKADGRGRPSVFVPTAKIKVLKKNPFREGSNSHKVFSMYKSGMTVGDFEKQVAKGSWKSTPRMFLAHHKANGYIKIGD